MMLTKSYTPAPLTEMTGHELDACLLEWALRETRYRAEHPEEMPPEARLSEMVPARDAGDVCHVCGKLVTWVDHLPPLEAEGPVRCYANVHYLNATQGVVVDDIFPRV